MVSDSLFCTFRENYLKTLDKRQCLSGISVAFFDTVKPSFPYGKVRSRKVAKSHQGIVKTLMLFDRVLCNFRKGHSKVIINDSVYQVFRNCFLHFSAMQFSLRKSKLWRCRETASGLTENLMLFGVLFVTFSPNASKSLHKRQCL